MLHSLLWKCDYWDLLCIWIMVKLDNSDSVCHWISAIGICARPTLHLLWFAWCKKRDTGTLCVYLYAFSIVIPSCLSGCCCDLQTHSSLLIRVLCYHLHSGAPEWNKENPVFLDRSTNTSVTIQVPTPATSVGITTQQLIQFRRPSQGWQTRTLPIGESVYTLQGLQPGSDYEVRTVLYQDGQPHVSPTLSVSTTTSGMDFLCVVHVWVSRSTSQCVKKLWNRDDILPSTHFSPTHTQTFSLSLFLSLSLSLYFSPSQVIFLSLPHLINLSEWIQLKNCVKPRMRAIFYCKELLLPQSWGSSRRACITSRSIRSKVGFSYSISAFQMLRDGSFHPTTRHRYQPTTFLFVCHRQQPTPGTMSLTDVSKATAAGPLGSPGLASTDKARVLQLVTWMLALPTNFNWEVSSQTTRHLLMVLVPHKSVQLRPVSAVSFCKLYFDN